MPGSTDESNIDPSISADDDYAHLIEDYSHLAPPSEDELLRGHVVSITKNEVIVDFGYKLEGLVPIEQVRQLDGSLAVVVGGEIDVMVDRHAPQPEGYVL